jgi:hypothetical protein
LHRLEEMKAFARITAPFDGVITARNVDIGTLINSGNGGVARELFHIAQIQVLRIFVNVPQTNVASMHPGQTAELRVQELPGQVFSARVTRIANALDATSRAMLTVLEVPNPRGVLMPGMYAQVRFSTGPRGGGRDRPGRRADPGPAGSPRCGGRAGPSHPSAPDPYRPGLRLRDRSRLRPCRGRSGGGQSVRRRAREMRCAVGQVECVRNSRNPFLSANTEGTTHRIQVNNTRSWPTLGGGMIKSSNGTRGPPDSRSDPAMGSAKACGK